MQHRVSSWSAGLQDATARRAVMRAGLARALATTCALAVILVGCAKDSANGNGESTGSSSQAVYGGTDDVDTPQANIVVNFNGVPASCTGTLISPKLVLTASHCINGSISPAGPEPKKPCQADPHPTIYFGANSFGDEPGTTTPWKRTTANAWTRVTGCVGKDADESGIDLAVVVLSASEPFLDHIDIHRPSFAAIPVSPNQPGSYTIGNIGFAGWSRYDQDDQTVDVNHELHRQRRFSTRSTWTSTKETRTVRQATIGNITTRTPGSVQATRVVRSSNSFPTARARLLAWQLRLAIATA